ncbi:MAG: hypothetical protein RJA61_606 [Candidatus Parcubacteria bacterium]|jgi:hypothetical protein
MKVLVLIPTRGFVEPACLHAIHAQDYTDYSTYVHILKPVKLHGDFEKDRVLNIVRNRNSIRELALKSDAEWFFWIDSDTIIPSNAISTFLRHNKPFMGGWYKKKDGSTWVAGKFLSNGQLSFYKEQPRDGEISVDLLGLGCSFMHRSVLEKISFDGGVDKWMTDTDGRRFFYAECAMFCESAKQSGIEPLLIREVVCSHIPVLT